METRSPIKELLHHAGLAEDSTSVVQSLAELLWKKAEVRGAVDDILRILQDLNIEVNGLVPSESCNKEQNFPRVLVYAVTEITRQLRQSATKAESDSARTGLGKAARQIEVAWSAVLTGDVDSLIDQIAGEEWGGATY